MVTAKVTDLWGWSFDDLVYCVHLIEVQSTGQNHHSYTTAQTGFSNAYTSQIGNNKLLDFLYGRLLCLRESVSSAYWWKYFACIECHFLFKTFPHILFFSHPWSREGSCIYFICCSLWTTNPEFKQNCLRRKWIMN